VARLGELYITRCKKNVKNWFAILCKIMHFTLDFNSEVINIVCKILANYRIKETVTYQDKLPDMEVCYVLFHTEEQIKSKQ
jgi:hypothetical protein